jgi:hypothetical protein
MYHTSSALPWPAKPATCPKNEEDDRQEASDAKEEGEPSQAVDSYEHFMHQGKQMRGSTFGEPGVRVPSVLIIAWKGPLPSLKPRQVNTETELHVVMSLMLHPRESILAVYR